MAAVRNGRRSITSRIVNRARGAARRRRPGQNERQGRFFHCAKSFKRSRLWQQEAWPEHQRVSFGKQMAERLGGDAKLAEQIDQAIEEDYETNL